MIDFFAFGPREQQFFGLLSINISLETDVLPLTLDLMWLVNEKMCELLGTGRFQESITWCYLPDAKNNDFFYILHMIAIFIYFFRQTKNAKQGLNFFWRSSTTPTKTCGSCLTPLPHNLALSPRRS